MKTNDIITGLRKLCGQGTEYRRTVCRLAADTIEAQQKRIEELEAERRWISVTERLPENDGVYLTFNKKKKYEFHFFQTGKRMWPAIWDDDGVTHWMPMPEPVPKEATQCP